MEEVKEVNIWSDDFINKLSGSDYKLLIENKEYMIFVINKMLDNTIVLDVIADNVADKISDINEEKLKTFKDELKKVDTYTSEAIYQNKDTIDEKKLTAFKSELKKVDAYTSEAIYQNQDVIDRIAHGLANSIGDGIDIADEIEFRKIAVELLMKRDNFKQLVLQKLTDKMQ